MVRGFFFGDRILNVGCFVFFFGLFLGREVLIVVLGIKVFFY